MDEPVHDPLLQQAMRLPVDDRADLARRLLESIHVESDPAVEAAWLEEIRRRVDALDRGAAITVPAAQVRAATLSSRERLRDAG